MSPLSQKQMSLQPTNATRVTDSTTSSNYSRDVLHLRREVHIAVHKSNKVLLWPNASYPAVSRVTGIRMWLCDLQNPQWPVNRWGSNFRLCPDSRPGPNARSSPALRVTWPQVRWVGSLLSSNRVPTLRHTPPRSHEDWAKCHLSKQSKLDDTQHHHNAQYH